MAKQKSPSPQELYRARKAREEKEKNALLPPGLVNHGNTCFMNSVLQGLIATQYLERLVLFQSIPSAIQAISPIHIASRRSPALTNAHGLGGEHDQPWTDGLPIGDQFIGVMRKAWEIQNNRQRECMSPKDLLAVLGKKYEQYWDFRQQDAHEFLCHLLDAIRMEEVDIIKKRSPPAGKDRSRTRQPSLKPSTSDPPSEQEGPPVAHPHVNGSSHPSVSSTDADDQPLSFVDMLFGGKLASILVCQACKHVSHTYEDFNDLSLSIKPEDYVRERKRDRLKQFAKKLGTALSVGSPAQRSSSVPATPVRDTTLDGPEDTDPPRRRSIDLADVEVVTEPAVEEKQDNPDLVKEGPAVQVPSPPVPDSPPIPVTPPPSDTPHAVAAADPQESQDISGEHITIVEPDKVNGKEKKEKDESWAKLGRRISVTVGLTRRSKQDRKEKKGTPLLSASKVPDDPNGYHFVSAPMTPVTGLVESDPALDREPPSLHAVNDYLHAQLSNVKRSAKSTQLSSNSPSIPSTPRFPLISRPSSPAPHAKRSKPPRAPKPSAEEAAYLRDILADINPPNVPKPFSIFKQPKEPSSSSFNSQNVFLKFNQISKIEECLRLFTSVEVLDGDNTVRCHRCWKIANGFYKPKPRESAQEPDSCSESEDEEGVGAKTISLSRVRDSTPANSIPATPSSNSPSPSYSTTSFQDTLLSHDTQSTLTHTSTRGPSKPIPPSLQLNDTYPLELTSPSTETEIHHGLTVPAISTTAPETPMSIKTARPTPSRENTISSVFTHTSGTVESSRFSLSAPPDQHRRQRFRSGDSNTESEYSEAESETLLSVYSDVSSAVSPNASPNASQDRLQQPSTSTRSASSKEKRHPSGVPRSKQYLLRPAYKRYLIATPPPILVVHLKRFQQISKAPVVSFSTGFKKLDDYIAFPEYLDLAPYLAPRREDYFDSKVAVTRGRSKRATPCMYRLYAVVVHIGNLLGGHYVAYTALPPSTSDSTAQSDSEKHQSNNGKAPRDWAFVSDTAVRLSTLEEVLKSKAYICMYERI